MRLELDPQDLKIVVREVLAEVLTAADWPTGRVALDEAEAAAACGVARHVLRDLRLAGRIEARKLGRKVLYMRHDLLRALGTPPEKSDCERGA
jgi:hypothetical protein